MEIGEKIIIALLVLVTVGVIGGAAIMMPILEHEMHKAESCGANCHEMQLFYDSLMVSSHAEVDCHDCHKPHKSEMFLYIGEALHHVEGLAEGMNEGKSLDETYGDMAEKVENKPPASPKNEYCMECHNEHKKPTENIADPTISCFKCHSTVRHTTHRISEYKGYETPDYSGFECVACHNDHDMDVKENTCLTCHPPERHP